MKKHPIFVTLLLMTIFVVSGISVAYLNTKNLCFDEDAKLITIKEDEIDILDFEIKYNDLKNKFETIKKYIPKNSIKTNPFIVPYAKDVLVAMEENLHSIIKDVYN